MALDHRNNRKLLWGIAAGLLAVLLAFFAISQWMNKRQSTTTQYTQRSAAPAKPQSNATSLASSTPQHSTNNLLDYNILDQPISIHASLAEDEIAQLDDIYAQLGKQEQLLKQQDINADALIELKQQQIKLLEAQLANQ